MMKFQRNCRYFEEFQGKGYKNGKINKKCVEKKRKFHKKLVFSEN